MCVFFFFLFKEMFEKRKKKEKNKILGLKIKPPFFQKEEKGEKVRFQNGVLLFLKLS